MRLPEHTSSKIGFFAAFACMLLYAPTSLAQKDQAPEKVIIDTDIGTDIDDAFAVAFALRSPELEILGFTTASGDTEARARILDRLLREANRPDIPVAAGPQSPFTKNAVGRQARYGERAATGRSRRLSAVDFILDQIRRSPAQITLVTLGPLTNVGALIDKDPITFRKLKRVVMMGGGLGMMDSLTQQTVKAREPQPEWNILCDITSAQKLFAAGVKISVMPIDATSQLGLDKAKRVLLLSEGTPLTDALGTLYLMWGEDTPTLHDVLPLAYMLEETLCPARPMRISIDDKGATHVGTGTPNAEACIHSDRDAFFELYMKRLRGSDRMTRATRPDDSGGPAASRN